MSQARLFDDLTPAPLSTPAVPYVRTSDTSRAAAESMAPHVETLRQLVFETIRKSGERGMTCDEVESALDLSHQTCSPRVKELADASRIVASGKRPTRSGRSANVWRAAR